MLFSLTTSVGLIKAKSIFDYIRLVAALLLRKVKVNYLMVTSGLENFLRK